MLLLGEQKATHGLCSAAVGRTINSGRATRRQAVIHAHCCTRWNSKSEGSGPSPRGYWTQSARVDRVILLLLIDPLASMGVKLLLSSGAESEVTMMKLWMKVTTTCIVFFLHVAVWKLQHSSLL